MNRATLIDRERRWALPVAIAAFAAFALLIGSTIASEGGRLLEAETTVEFLRKFEGHGGELLASSLLRAAGIALFIPPLAYLFLAAADRSQTVRRGLLGIVIAGPVFLAVSAILQWIAFDRAAADFATPGGGVGIPIGEYAEDLIKDQPTFGASQGFAFGGVIGFVVGVVYTGLQAMRAGLVTRFFGTLGMALGATTILLAQSIALLAVALWFVWLGLLILGRVPGGRPPAWEAGRAMPWPKPGEEEPADPREFQANDEEEAAPAPAAQGQHAARRERARKRKRKRRG